jgi:hypothetical protein
MRKTFASTLEEEGIAGVMGEIASVLEILELQCNTHMRKFETKYLR